MADVKDNPIINYVAAAAQQHAADNLAKLDIQKQLDKQEEANADAMLAASIAGGSKATQIAAEESWKASSDAGIAAMQEALGSSWTTQGSQSNIWAARMKEDGEKAYQTLDVIKEKQGKTLLNDPIGFIEAQFSLPADVEAHNYYVRKHNIAEGRLNEVIGASNNAAIAIKQMEKRTSTEFALGKAQEAMALAAGNVAALKRQAAGDSIRGITEINNLNAKQADMVFRVHAMQNSDASLALQRKSQADAHADRVAALAAKQESKDTLLEEQQAMMEYRNLGAKAIGKAPVTDLKMFMREYSMLGKTPEYQDMTARGYGMALNGGNLNGIPVAKDAGSAARNYASGGGTNLTNNPVGSLLATIYSDQKSHPTAPKDPAAFAEVVNKVAVSTAENMRRSIDNSNPNSPNIYAAPPVGVMFKSFAVMNDPFMVATVKPMLDLNPSLQISDATMLAKAAEFAKGNKANFNMAAESITDYYKRASILNESNKLFAEHGLPPQKGYNARIDGRNINLTDITQVKRYLLSKSMPTMFNPFPEYTGKPTASVKE